MDTIRRIIFDASTGERAAEITRKNERAIVDVDKATDKYGRTAASVASSMLGVGGIVGATILLTSKIKDGVAASRDQAQANRLLDASFQGPTGSLRRYAAELEAQTGISDNLLVRQEAMIAAMGFTEEQIRDIVKAAAGLNITFGLEMTSAVRNLAKSYSGLSGELGEMLPQFRALNAEQLRSGEAVRVAIGITEQGMGQAKDKLTDLEVGWHNFWEAAGGPVANAAGGAAGKTLGGLALYFQRVKEKAGESRDAYSEFLGGILGFTSSDVSAELAAAREEMVKLLQAGSGGTAQDAVDRAAELREKWARAREELARLGQEAPRTAAQIAAAVREAGLENGRLPWMAGPQGVDMMDSSWFEDGIDWTREIAEAEDRHAESLRRVRQAQIAAADADMYRQRSIGSLAGSLGGLNAAFKGSSEVTKRLMQGQAVIDTYAAANNALATVRPFPLALVAAATAVATGLANVAQIQAQRFARGGDFVTTGPQLIMVGDNPGGRERVQITPTSSPNYDGPQGGIVLNFYGPADEDYVRDVVVPAVERARRRGLA